MQEWIRQVLEAPQFGASAPLAALLLGAVSAFGSSCCSLPLVAAVIGYAGTQESRARRDALWTAVSFMMGTVLALGALGALIGYFGYLAGGRTGLYGRLFAGLVAVFFGLITLNLLPIRAPDLRVPGGKRPAGRAGAALFGLAVGAASVGCTMVCCGPLLPVALGLAAFRGQAGWGALILAMFAVGYSVPLGAMVFGVSMGRMAGVVGKAARPIRIAAGVCLLGVGFWFLATL